MRYALEMEIASPRDKLVAMLTDTAALKSWQPDLIAFEPLLGEPGTEGATAKLRYRMGKGEIEMTETIQSCKLPGEITFTYEAKGVWNWVINLFDEMDDGRTRWRFECEFRFQGFMKILALFMPWMFKKQSRQYMNQFKQFAEQKS